MFSTITITLLLYNLYTPWVVQSHKFVHRVRTSLDKRRGSKQKSLDKNSYGNKCDFKMLPLLLREGCGEEKLNFIVSGMNEGQLTDVLLKSCSSAYVHGFEIQSKVYEGLLLKYASSKNVFVNNMALSNRKGELPVTGSGEGAGVYNTFRNITHWNTKTTVPSINLAQYHPDNKFDLVVIDVEGHEPEVIQGMQLELNFLRYPIIMYELGGTWADSRHSSSWTQYHMAMYLDQLGYGLYLLGCEDVLPVDKTFFNSSELLQDEGFGPFIQGNVIAVLRNI